MDTTWLTQKHLEAVLDIERRSFDQPWNEKDFQDTMRRNGVVGLAAFSGGEEDGRLTGFIIYSLDKGHVTVLNLAVHPHFRRKRIGSALIKRVKEKLASGRRIRIVANVRETNLAAQLFLRSQEFKCDAILPRHYEEEPAYRFNYTLPVKYNTGVKELA